MNRMRNARNPLIVCFFSLILLACLTNVSTVRAANTLTLNSVGRTETTITLAWSHTQDGLLFSNYALYGSASGANGSFTNIFTSTDASNTSVVVSGLLPKTTYSFYIVDTGALWVGTTISVIISVTTSSPPILSLTSFTLSTASLAWTDTNIYSDVSAPFRSYTVQMCTSGANGVPSGAWSTLMTITNRAQNTYTVTGLNVGIYYFRIYISTGVDSSYSNFVIDPVDTLTIAPNTLTTMQVGQHTQFTATATGGSGTFIYQWYSNGSAIPDATSANFVFTPTSYGLYNINVIAQDAIFGYLIAPLSSTVVPVTVTPTSITASISTSGSSIQVNQQTQFIVTATGGTGSYIYKWFVNGAQQSATSGTFTLNPTQAGNYNIYATVSDLLYPTIPLATTSSITVSVIQPTPTPTPSPVPTPLATQTPAQISTQSPTQTPIPSTVQNANSTPINQTPSPSVPEFGTALIFIPLLFLIGIMVLLIMKKRKQHITTRSYFSSAS